MTPAEHKRLVRTTLLSGVLSIASYIILFTHQDWVVDNFTRGGAYAVLPIATAFYFSFVHGTFTSSLLHLFGLRANSPAPQTQPEGSLQDEGRA